MGATMPAALIMATVAEPTAKCISPATSHARMMGFILNCASEPASAVPTPLSIRMPLKAPPAPMISRMLASGGRLFWVCLSKSCMDRPRRRPSAQ
ncbi:hypothetical protein D3C78_1596460 [compost metagenome]